MPSRSEMNKKIETLFSIQASCPRPHSRHCSNIHGSQRSRPRINLLYLADFISRTWNKQDQYQHYIYIPICIVEHILFPDSDWLDKFSLIECWIRLPASPPSIRLRPFIRLTHHGLFPRLLAALLLVWRPWQVQPRLRANRTDQM